MYLGNKVDGDMGEGRHMPVQFAIGRPRIDGALYALSLLTVLDKSASIDPDV